SGDIVRISAGADGSQAWIQIADSGPGIPHEEQERIFEPFYRGKTDERFPQGLGLGLTIARDLVLAHDGQLELESTPGAGSTFTITLPRYEAQSHV
ncbi:MAG TPA: ATP-binding protein, partial [Candidatus Sulfomarinibacteraceae bacterium]|nr:ATP-binding protein [Candidatus Sulfomarinibacteraceae bacterium]